MVAFVYVKESGGTNRKPVQGSLGNPSVLKPQDVGRLSWMKQLSIRTRAAPRVHTSGVIVQA